ncbi:MAG: hypothetical protein B9S32_13430 [Verrucomicrobia bacterium Tous-C9LFEB]|nr:MAG: hypothetical protein B9S32_13430 [Verrucomicrobia bacterium Tous-C9LFEB]
MTIECESRDGVEIFHLTGRFDGSSANDAQKVLLSKADFTPLRVVLNLAGIEVITSAGLRAILALVKKVEANAGKLAVTGLSTSTREIFEISGFNRIIPLQASLESAVAQVGEV